MTLELSFMKDTELPRILFSLKSTYFERILSKEKRFEYRRKFFKHPCIGFIFVNSPVSAVCGFVEFGARIIAPIEVIAKIAGSERQGGETSIREYMKGLRAGFAVPIVSVCRIEPVSLAEIRAVYPGFHPPQS